MKCISAWIVLWMIYCKMFKSSNGIRSLSPTIMPATRFTVTNSSKRMLAHTRLQCVNACLQSTLCQTMNYFSGESYCDLFDQSIDQGQLLIDATAETIYCFNGCTYRCRPSCEHQGICVSSNQCLCPVGYSGVTCRTQSSGLCSNPAGQTIFSNTFGSGSSLFSNATPANWSFTTNYVQLFATPINDGQFGVMNSVPSLYSWHGGATDHTVSDVNGYMLLFNLVGPVAPFYTQTFSHLCVGQRYEFSLYLANLVQQSANYVNPNIRLEVRSTSNWTDLIALWNVSEIIDQNSFTWIHHGISFVTPISSVDILVITQVSSGVGNDLAVDDIKLRTCSTNNLTTCP